jgi:hypothetical protein
VQRVHDRALPWLRKHKYLDDRPAEERSNESPATTPIDAFASMGLGGGTFLGKPFAPRESDGDQHERKEKRFSASCNGFDVHCAVRIAGPGFGGSLSSMSSMAIQPFGSFTGGRAPCGLGSSACRPLEPTASTRARRYATSVP